MKPKPAGAIDPRALAKRIRIHALHMTSAGGSSHIGAAFSIADILAVLYGRILRVDPANPGWEDRDRFILSKGHAGAAVYAVLAECGFFPVEKLKTHYQDGSDLSGHVSHKGVPGVEVSTGSLGHGLSIGAGMALGAKMDKADYRVFVLLSDGECDEGSTWEAVLFAAHHRLDNLVAIVDYNKFQLDGAIAEILDLEPLADKWRAMKWHVREIDGHDLGAVLEGLEWATSQRCPACLIAHTVKGKGVSFMEGENAYHGVAPTEEELARALGELEDVLTRAEHSIEREAAEEREAGR